MVVIRTRELYKEAPENPDVSKLFLMFCIILICLFLYFFILGKFNRVNQSTNIPNGSSVIWTQKYWIRLCFSVLLANYRDFFVSFLKQGFAVQFRLALTPFVTLAGLDSQQFPCISLPSTPPQYRCTSPCLASIG